MTASPIPEGFHTVTPYLVVYDAAAAIDFYKRAFGAVELCRMTLPGTDRIVHAEIRIGDGIIMLSTEMRDFGQTAPTTLGGTTTSIHLYVENADEAFERALLAGASVECPLMDAFWGDRYGKLKDPFGHSWSLATHVRDVTPEEMQKGAETCLKEAVPC